LTDIVDTSPLVLYAVDMPDFLKKLLKIFRPGPWTLLLILRKLVSRLPMPAKLIVCILAAAGFFWWLWTGAGPVATLAASAIGVFTFAKLRSLLGTIISLIPGIGGLIALLS